MGLAIKDAGTLRTISRLYIRQSGVNRRIRTLKVMDGGTLRTVAVFADALTVSAFNVRGIDSSSTVTTRETTATVSGGFGPYTYLWERVIAGGGDASTAATPTRASTAFTKTGMFPGQSSTDTWRVTVTDSTGATATTEISATFDYSTGATG